MKLHQSNYVKNTSFLNAPTTKDEGEATTAAAAAETSMLTTAPSVATLRLHNDREKVLRTAGNNQEATTYSLNAVLQASSSVTALQRTSSEPDLRIINKKHPKFRRHSEGNLASEIGTLHDQMFNNRDKVAFESALATVLFNHSKFFEPVITKTIRKLGFLVMPVLEKNLSFLKNPELFEKPSAAELGLFKCFTGDKNFLTSYHAYTTKSVGLYPMNEKASKPESVEEAEAMVRYFRTHVFNESSDTATLDEKLTAIYNFGDFMTRPFKFAQEGFSWDNIDFVENSIKSTMKKHWESYKINHGIPGLFSSKPPGYKSESRAERIRNYEENSSGNYAGIWPVHAKRSIAPINTSQNRLTPDISSPPIYRVTGAGLWQPRIADARMYPNEKSKSASEKRGTDLMNREKDFAYKAMYEVDMPLIAGASGAIGASLITFLSVGGLTKQEEIQKAFLAAFSELGIKGYHSFHEAAEVAKILGVKYESGNYSSAIPSQWIDVHPGLQDLRLKFPEFLPMSA